MVLQSGPVAGCRALVLRDTSAGSVLALLTWLGKHDGLGDSQSIFRPCLGCFCSVSPDTLRSDQLCLRSPRPSHWDGDGMAAVQGVLVPSCGELVTKALCCGAAGAFSA